MTQPNALQTAEQKSVAISEHGFAPSNAKELMDIAKFVAASALVPEALRGKPADCFLVMALGREYGFSEMKSLQVFHVIKGRLVIPGETCGELIQSHPECRDYRIWFEGEGDALTAYVQTHRKGREKPNEPTSFSWGEAKAAKLTDGDNWRKYPKDMLCWKAVAREKRRNWPDVLPRLQVREDIEEAPERNITPARERPVAPPLDPARALLGPAPFAVQIESVDTTQQYEVFSDSVVSAAEAPDQGPRAEVEDPILADPPQGRPLTEADVESAIKRRSELERGGNAKFPWRAFENRLRKAVRELYPDLTTQDALQAAIDDVPGIEVEV